MTSTTTTLQEPTTGGKTAPTRLLDLLAGWSAFVSMDEDSKVQDPGLSAEQISQLYQEAGEEVERWEQLSEEARDQAVAQFVAERVLPLILRGRAARSVDG